MSSGNDKDLGYWFCTPENHMLGSVDDQGSISQFWILYPVNSKAHVGSNGATVCTEYIDGGDHELPCCSEANSFSNSISLSVMPKDCLISFFFFFCFVLC